MTRLIHQLLILDKMQIGQIVDRIEIAVPAKHGLPLLVPTSGIIDPAVGAIHNQNQILSKFGSEHQVYTVTVSERNT